MVSGGLLVTSSVGIQNYGKVNHVVYFFPQDKKVTKV